MKNLIFLFSLLMVIQVSSQNEIINFRNWSDPVPFAQISNEITETGLGEFSNALAEANDGNTYYVADGEYFVINSAADYYLWYWKKFPEDFKVPYDKYAKAYVRQNNLLMLSLVQLKFRGEQLPLDFEYFSEENARFHVRVKDDAYFNSMYASYMSKNGRTRQNDQEIRNDFFINSSSVHLANRLVVPRSEQNGAGRPGSVDGVQRNRSSQ